MRLNVSLIPILIIGLLLGGMAVVSRGPAITPTAIYTAESGYAVALAGADAYRHLCVGDPASGTPAILPVSCKGVLVVIQADVKITDAAYQKVKGYEANPPVGAAADFIAALTVLKAAIPAV